VDVVRLGAHRLRAGRFDVEELAQVRPPEARGVRDEEAVGGQRVERRGVGHVGP
jgi:hypothetical protein